MDAESLRMKRRRYEPKKLNPMHESDHDGHADNEGQSDQSVADHEDHSVDRRVPSGFQRHQPINRRESHGQTVQDEPRAAEILQPLDERGIGSAILLSRPPGQKSADQNPDPKIQSGAKTKR